jgi:endonuclease/exonuclease/phosphatase family metal-dependent hydrolase
MVVEGLRSLRVDVIGLQEASVGRQRGNVASRLATELGFFHVYAPANPRPVNSERIHRALASLLDFSEGPAIVSRFPIVAWSAHPLPRCGKLAESRVLLSATLQSPWGGLHVFSAHTAGGPCQTERVAEIVAGQRRPLPAVLMGDFNAAEGSPALMALRERADFVDTFRATHPTLPGSTVWQRVDAATPTVHRRVDYIFLVPGERYHGKVLSSDVVLNRPRRFEGGRVLWPSDHYGVLTELTVFPPSHDNGAQREALATPPR